MKRIPTTFILLTLLSLSLWATEDKESRGARTILKLSQKPLAWSLPQEGTDFHRRTLASGVTFYAKVDGTIPLFQLNCFIRAGVVFEKTFAPQSAKVTAAMIRECSSTDLPAAAIEKQLSLHAGELKVVCGPDLVHLSGSIPSPQAAYLTRIVAALCSRPDFTQEKLDFLLRRLADETRNAAEDPYFLCQQKFFQLVYRDHPYGLLYSAAGLDSIRLEDVRRYFRQTFVPQNIYLVLTGDFNEDELVKVWNTHYREHPRRDNPPLPAVAGETVRPGVFLLQKDINQTSIYFGMPGVTPDAGDLHAIHLLNHMVGGSSFASRFTQEVRDKEGLAYRVGSTFDTHLLGRGAFIARCRTKTASTVRALDAMLWILELFRENRISTTEFEIGRDGLKNGFVKRFATVEDLLANFLMLDILGRSPSFLAEYQSRVQAVNQAELTRIARKYLHPEHMTFMLVGNVLPLKEELRKFGEIHLVSDSDALVVTPAVTRTDRTKPESTNAAR